MILPHESSCLKLKIAKEHLTKQGMPKARFKNFAKILMVIIMQ